MSQKLLDMTKQYADLDIIKMLGENNANLIKIRNIAVFANLSKTS